MKKIAVIGFGAAAIGFLWQFRNNDNYEIEVFENGENVMSSNLSGIKADGKLIMSEEMGSDIYIPLNVQKEAMDIYANESKHTYKIYNSFDNNDYLRFYNAGFQPVRSTMIHIGTDKLKEIIPVLYDEIKKSRNIIFNFDHNIKEVDKFKWVDNSKFDYIVVAVGRSGYKLVDHMIGIDEDLHHNEEKQIVDIGVRFELPETIVRDLN